MVEYRYDKLNFTLHVISKLLVLFRVVKSSYLVFEYFVAVLLTFLPFQRWPDEYTTAKKNPIFVLLLNLEITSANAV